MKTPTKFSSFVTGKGKKVASTKSRAGGMRGALFTTNSNNETTIDESMNMAATQTTTECVPETTYAESEITSAPNTSSYFTRTLMADDELSDR